MVAPFSRSSFKARPSWPWAAWPSASRRSCGTSHFWALSRDGARLLGTCDLDVSRHDARSRPALPSAPGPLEMAACRPAMGSELEALSQGREERCGLAGRRCRIAGSFRLEDLSVQGDANFADLAVGRLPAADLVGVELALGVEILPGFLEVDAGRWTSSRPSRAGAGTWSKETAFLVMPGRQVGVVTTGDREAHGRAPRRCETSTFPVRAGRMAWRDSGAQ